MTARPSPRYIGSSPVIAALTPMLGVKLGVAQERVDVEVSELMPGLFARRDNAPVTSGNNAPK